MGVPVGGTPRTIVVLRLLLPSFDSATMSCPSASTQRGIDCPARERWRRPHPRRSSMYRLERGHLDVADVCGVPGGWSADRGRRRRERRSCRRGPVAGVSLVGDCDVDRRRTVGCRRTGRERGDDEVGACARSRCRGRGRGALVDVGAAVPVGAGVGVGAPDGANRYRPPPLRSVR